MSQEIEKVAKPKRPITIVDRFAHELNENYRKAITHYFQNDETKLMRFLTAAKYAFQTVPKLQECDKDSVLTAFMTCAEFGLYPSSVSGEAYVLPYKGKAQFQLGVQGIITLLYKAGMSNISADIVYEKDFFKFESGLNPSLIHKPDIFAEDRGEAIAVYAVATMPSGERQFKVLPKKDVMKFKEFSMSKDSPYSPWNPKNDPELSMWRKTAIKQLAKYLPKNSTIFEAIAKDNQDSRISEVKNLLPSAHIKMGELLIDKNEKHNEEAIEPEIENEAVIDDADSPTEE